MRDADKGEADSQLTGWEHPAARLNEALDHDHFRLYAQPVAALGNSAGVELAEVLVRLSEEEERMLPPGDFLPVFEHYGMMGQLDRWVVRHTVRRLEQGGSIKRVSINVSWQA